MSGILSLVFTSGIVSGKVLVPAYCTVEYVRPDCLVVGVFDVRLCVVSAGCAVLDADKVAVEGIVRPRALNALCRREIAVRGFEIFNSDGRNLAEIRRGRNLKGKSHHSELFAVAGEVEARIGHCRPLCCGDKRPAAVPGRAHRVAVLAQVAKILRECAAADCNGSFFAVVDDFVDREFSVFDYELLVLGALADNCCRGNVVVAAEGNRAVCAVCGRNQSSVCQ